MGAQDHHRLKIHNQHQHPYRHRLSEFPYTNDVFGEDVVNAQQALDWVLKVIYPQPMPSVANVAALPAVGNTLNDYRVVRDDGDGRSAGYRWEQREGEVSASWHKIYDFDWGVDSVLSQFYQKTLDLYVAKYGYDDRDGSGNLLTDVDAGQHFYGGKAASSHLTLHANSGDGTGAQTGYIQFADAVRPTTNNERDLGTTALRFRSAYLGTSLLIGDLTIADGLITDADGTISFDDEDLVTTGDITAGSLVVGSITVDTTLALASGSITDSTGLIDFGNTDLETNGSMTIGTILIQSGLTEASITDSTGVFDFNDDDLLTTGTMGAGIGDFGEVDVDNLNFDLNTIQATSGDLIFDAADTINFLATMLTEDITATGTVAVTGQLDVDNLRLDGNTLSVQDVNGNLTLSANGNGFLYTSTEFLPTSDNALDIGALASRFQSLHLSNGISDGTNIMLMADLLSLRDINAGVGAGYSLFYNGSKWVASAPDTEIDHGTISGLLDDDHTQYALLAGRSGGQTLNGGTASGDDLYLVSTSHGTKGNVFFTGHLAPTSDGVYDIGGSGADFRHIYMDGELKGARFETFTTAGRPAAGAGTVGRVIWDTDLSDMMVDTGGTWKKFSIEKHVFEDTTGWDGVATSVIYTVSADISDARNAIWSLKNNSDSFKQILCDITCSATQVTVTVDVPLAAGTYTLVGVG